MKLSLLLNELPSRSASSSFAPRAAPTRSAAFMSSLLHLTVRKQSRSFSLCLYHRLVVRPLELADVAQRNLGLLLRNGPFSDRVGRSCRVRRLPITRVAPALSLYSSGGFVGWALCALLCAACAMIHSARCMCGPRVVGRTSAGLADVARRAASASRRASGLLTAVYIQVK